MLLCQLAHYFLFRGRPTYFNLFAFKGWEYGPTYAGSHLLYIHQQENSNGRRSPKNCPILEFPFIQILLIDNRMFEESLLKILKC